MEKKGSIFRGGEVGPETQMLMCLEALWVDQDGGERNVWIRKLERRGQIMQINSLCVFFFKL